MRILIGVAGDFDELLLKLRIGNMLEMVGVAVNIRLAVAHGIAKVSFPQAMGANQSLPCRYAPGRQGQSRLAGPDQSLPREIPGHQSDRGPGL